MTGNQLDLFTTAPVPTPGLSVAEKLAQRGPRIAASKAAGNVHLDQMIPYPECLRRRRIANVHDPRERGTIFTVSNRGDVVVQWKDAYSLSKNYLAEYHDVRPRKKPLKRASWLRVNELEDYLILDTTFEIEARIGRIKPAAILKYKRMREKLMKEREG